MVVAANVGELIERLGAERRDLPFVVDPQTGRVMTFADLRRHVASMLMRLRGLKVQRGDRVCVAMDNGPAAVVCHLALMSGGLVAVPLDPHGSRSQQAEMLAHCGARLILVERSEKTDLASAELGAGVEKVELDLECPVEEGLEPSTEALPDTSPDAEALLAYTSGSTGSPKGVMLSHADVLARAVERARSHGLSTDDRLLCVMPLYHMNAQNIMLGILYSGGSMVIPPRFSVARFWGWAVDYQCTWLSVVPTFVVQLLRWSETHPVPSADELRKVRFARCSSAPLNDAVHRAFEERFGIILAQGMGMTEAGGIFLNPPEQRKIGSLGRAPALTVKVVDQDGRELGDGQIGELMVRGPGVARGYYKNPEATAAAFDAAGWLRTGDLVYRDNDGYFFHAGRIKDLIIKGGVNVAPQVVDAALESHPDVLQAATVGVADPNLGEDIGAFVRLRSGARCRERDILEHCAQRVGEFQTPSWLRFVDELPTGPTGKVRRSVLAEVAVAALGGARRTPEPPTRTARMKGVAPRTPEEHAIAAVWADVIRCRHASIHDDFFALGGTSLDALDVTTRLRQALGVQLSLGDVLAAPTIAGQAEMIADRQRRKIFETTEPAERQSEVVPAFATPLAPIEEGRAGPPLFCFYDIARFIRLAQCLRPQHPVYGVTLRPILTAIGGTASIATFSTYSVEMLASLCLPEIRRVQPVGPYQVVGFSFGGRLALEVAQQLRDAGDEVALLAILDTFMPGSLGRRFVPWFNFHVSQLVNRGPRHLTTAWRQHRGLTADPDEKVTRMYRDTAFRRSLGARYRPRRYSGRIVLFRAAAPDVASYFRIDSSLGWRCIARGPFSVHDVQGKHLELLDESRAPQVADLLRSYLQK